MNSKERQILRDKVNEENNALLKEILEILKKLENKSERKTSKKN
jgi:hypothetical protein